MPFSGYLPFVVAESQPLKSYFSESNLKTPIHIFHGKQDQVVRVAAGVHAHKAVTAARTEALKESSPDAEVDVQISISLYDDLEHSVNDESIRDAQRQLLKWLPAR